MTTALMLPSADTWGMHGNVGAGWWIVMLVGMGVVILVAFWLVRGFASGSGDHAMDTPMDVLQRRFAEGTISVEDYERRRGLLAESDAAALDQAVERDEPVVGAATAPPSGGGAER